MSYIKREKEEQTAKDRHRLFWIVNSKETLQEYQMRIIKTDRKAKTICRKGYKRE
jgi:hypothetical protein